MGIVVAFRPRTGTSEMISDDDDIDLATAVDVAIRDLREIREKWGQDSAYHQAEACLTMLERAFNATT